ncbi:pentatricopeptide repeat-containing protein [Cucumis melo var. makuwa]|uniref:Pentatricopeptide repeat-containing protein At5g08305 n=2 Tax=Cucumis melo TaxID=3656 RepID=A0A1S3CCZ9_CUCME|nr:pentatricopeptide repeat-containing protein At5g08305 [Cucumis melo]XP_008460458.1 pentatricopeptide repeat-containing protein At5g08305 [Cucumis melo]TYK26520.1 pentatricopeptide repeat-containing protein [Cucumis melo var. makuwa]
MMNATSFRKIAFLNQNLISLLDGCKSMFELKRIHALLFTLGISQDEIIKSKLLLFSALSPARDLDYSYKLILNLPNPTTFNWNTLIRGFSNTKNPNPSITVFIKMLQNGVSPNYLTYPFLVKATSKLLNQELGMALHVHIVKSGHEIDKFIQNSLIHMYASCRDIASARKVFDEMATKNLVTWNAMLDGYAKCGNLNMAREVFSLMPERDVVSWSSLIDGYVKGGVYGEAMALFERMSFVGPMANEVTLVSVLCACAHLGALERGRMMHRYIVENELPLTIVLQTSLVDMYAKCGAIHEALTVFRACSLQEADVLIWNAIIGGLATHGLIKESLDLFCKMQMVGIVPDEITYLCLLSCCAHGGLVEEAWYFFDCLRKHGMFPKVEHYACMVDVLSRAGQVSEAYQFLCQMPVQPTSSMLGALLSGCMKHGKLDIAKVVGRRLVELDPNHDGRYVGLSNIYAADKRWDDAKNMREAMERKGMKKSPGFSFIEVYGILHRFMAHDKTHGDSKQIFMMLNFIVDQMKPIEDYVHQECCFYDIINIS